jgi:D-alanyl-lipoteichoic acid acyltransferase DltB (MBOAT superfamily)
MFDSLIFWASLGATAAVFGLMPPAWVRARSAALISTSILVLALVVGIDPWFGLMLLIAVAWVTLAARLAAAFRGRRGLLLYLLGPVAIVWIAGKEASAYHFAWFQFIGFSFFFIKAWTFLKDVQDRRIERPDSLVVASYFLHFPTFVSGPMHLFGEFDRSLRAPDFPDFEGFTDVVFRLLLGFAKVKVLAPLFVPISLDALVASGPLSVTTLAVGSLAYSVVILANFSGYTDLAVATSRLMGMHVPENFDYPYAAPNIREFWQRWHMSFTRVLTSYVFIPLSRRLQGPLGDRPKALMIACTLITFLFVGFWHGPTLNFLLWGLYHALGLIAFDFYRPGAMRRRLRRKGSPNAAFINRVERSLGIALTFSFVSAGWIFFVFPVSRFWAN